MNPRFYLFLDSTEFHENSALNTPEWQSLLAAGRQGFVSVAVSEVTVLEVVRQIRERVEVDLVKLGSVARRMHAHAIDYISPPPIDTAGVEDDVRRRFTQHGISILPLPAVDLVTVLSRDLRGKKPFAASGKGFRDTLIWLTFEEWAGHLDRDGDIRFVSRNVNDFADKNQAQLDPSLLTDLPQGLTVTYSKSLSEAVSVIRASSADLSLEEFEPQDPSYADVHPAARLFGDHRLEVVEDHGAEAMLGLLDFPVDDLPVDAPYISFPDIHQGAVIAIELRGDEESELVDNFDDTQIWRVRDSALLTIQGVVHITEIPDLPAGWHVSAIQDGVRFVSISASLPATVTVELEMAGEDLLSSEVVQIVLREAQS